MQFYTFGLPSSAAGDATVAELGGKGAGLVWMSAQGASVPPGFVIPVSVWAEYDAKPKTTLKAIAKALPEYLAQLEQQFGYRPLLSVRSGSRVSCPGMMDTILNVGIDAETRSGWINRLGEECFTDSFHRLVVMYGSVVKGIERARLETSLQGALDVYRQETGEDFPEAEAQVLGAIEAVFKSWDNDRAETYRRLNSIPREYGTAVTVQAMVFGNRDAQSGSGVLFTRNPNTGAFCVTGEWLPQAQGEDIVAGIRTPEPLATLKTWNPEVYAELHAQVLALENAKRDVQDVEFTIQSGKLYLLQTRTAKRSAYAAVKIAVDLVAQGLITPAEAVSRVTPRQFDLAQVTQIDPAFTGLPLYTGLAGCNGVVTGRPVFSAKAAVEATEPVILVTDETTPDDIDGMHKAVGVLTMTGGFTCHAAVVARGMNRACVVGLGQSTAAFADVDTLTIDGATGRVWTSAVPVTNGNPAVIAQYAALVHQVLGTIPVLTAEPTESYATALLYLGHQVFDTPKAAVTVLETLQKVQTVYLDLSAPTDPVEQAFFSLGAAEKWVEKLVLFLEQVYTNIPADSYLHDRKLVLVGAQSKVFPGVNSPSDLSSLVLAPSAFTVEKLDLTDPAIHRVLAWKQAEGAQVLSFGVYAPGATSVVSLEQALHLVAEGR